MANTYLRIYALIAIIVHRSILANRLSCVCSLAECENVNESDCPNGAGTVWDSCKCCRICARVENEPCGGPFGFSGSCAFGLECVYSDLMNANPVGVCTKIRNEDSCDDPKVVSGCNIVDRSSCKCESAHVCVDDHPFNFRTRQECLMNLDAMLKRNSDDYDNEDILNDEENASINCPPDSIQLSNDECECQRDKCQPALKSCAPGLLPTITRNGSNVAGECCDIWECKPNSTKNCSNVQCPETPVCPSDSYSLPARTTIGECCAESLGCQCLPNCEPFTCSPDMTPFILVNATGLPGRCCPLYECRRSDTPPKNHEDSSEEALGCLNPDNNFFKHGTNWTSPDFCTTCTCQYGHSRCRAFACTPCLRPVKVPGKCCPHCDDGIHVQPAHCPPIPNCTEPCSNGMVKDENDCLTCKCRDCPIDCTYNVNSNGEHICDCKSNGTTTAGETLNTICRRLENCDKICPYGYRKNAAGCDTCECGKCPKQCSRGYLADEHGNVLCKCKPWNIFLEGNNNIADSVSCKTDYFEQTVWRDDGELWFDDGRQCSCISGREMCSLAHCPLQLDGNRLGNSTTGYCLTDSADDPFANEQLNQIICANNSRMMLQGETISLDRCTQCVCHEGTALCRTKECPPVCPKSRPHNDGECCPTCDVSDDNFENDQNYLAIGEKCESSLMGNSSIRTSNCVSCRCIKNEKYCFTERCLSFGGCKRSFSVKGRCCPVCVDNFERYKSVSRCQYANRTYDDTEEWIVDACRSCKCILGRVVCIDQRCTEICANPVRREVGRCCPICGAEDSIKFTQNVQEIFYVTALFVIVIVCVALAVCVMRHWRYKKQQLRLHDLTYLTPQYQYKCVPTSPYDDRNSPKIVTSDKILLAPV